MGVVGSAREWGQEWGLATCAHALFTRPMYRVRPEPGRRFAWRDGIRYCVERVYVDAKTGRMHRAVGPRRKPHKGRTTAFMSIESASARRS